MAQNLEHNYYLLQKEVEQKDEFLAIASHELKTPLTTIKAYTQVLSRYADGLKDGQTGKILQKMDREINRVNLLVTDLLDLSKIQGGNLHLHPATFPLNRLIDDVVTQMSLVINHHPLRKHLRKNVTICADRDRLGQVLINLISNAHLYSPKSAPITIATQVETQRVIVSVKDEGIGISKNEQKKIFARYYRSGYHQKEKAPGLGLGLYISREIITGHGGKIWVESQPGKGTTFFFSLPLA